MAFYFFHLVFQIRVTSALLNGFIPLSQAPSSQARNKECTPGERAKWEDMMLKVAHPSLLDTSLSFRWQPAQLQCKVIGCRTKFPNLESIKKRISAKITKFHTCQFSHYTVYSSNWGSSFPCSTFLTAYSTFEPCEETCFSSRGSKIQCAIKRPEWETAWECASP